MTRRLHAARRIEAVIGLVILAAAGASRPAAGQDLTRGVAGSEYEYEEDIQIAIQSLDSFWTGEFRALGLTYERPSGFFTYDMDEPLAGIPCSPSGANAMYCALDDAIYWEEPNLMRPWHEYIGDFAPLFVIAHEWAHSVQNRAGILANSIETELQADCLAGAWAQYAEDTEGIIEDGDIDEALIGLMRIRDPVGLPWLDPRAHGTGSQRIEAFLLGYRSGRLNCNGPMPAPPKRRS